MANNFLDEIKGAIIDLDGTILDSAWVWDKVDEEFLGARGFDVPENYVETISPMGAKKAAIYTKEEFGLDDENIEDIMAEWFEMAKHEYRDDVSCKPFAKEYIKKLYENNIRIAVATSSDRVLFMPTLEREGLVGYIEEIVTVDEVPRGKGFPDIYLEAARRIGVAPTECVVFEDILLGASAAKEGGFFVVGVKDKKSLHNREKIEKITDLYIEGFEDIL